MASLITVEEFKNYPMPITAAQWAKIGDDQLALIIQYASDHLEDYMDRQIGVINYIDRLTGSDGAALLLTTPPVLSLNHVTAYDNRGNPFAYNSSNFFIDRESAIIEFTDWYRYRFYGSQKWMVDYHAGFTATPGPIKHAVALQTTKMLQPLFRGGTNFQEVELITELDEQVVELLDKYKKRRIG